MIGRIRTRLAAEHGYSLVELVTVVAILTIVISSLTTVFVSASNGELDMNRRFQAQQNARLAMDKLRRGDPLRDLGGLRPAARRRRS